MVNHADVVCFLADIIRPKSYLELGVLGGGTFLRVCPKAVRAIGVDVSKQIQVPKNAEFFQCTTDEFFAAHNKDRKHDLIFIDANHDLPFVQSDLANALDVLAPGGLVALHDTDPVRQQLTAHHLCSTAYKLIDSFLIGKPHLHHITLPVEDYGVTIVRRDSDRRCLGWSTGG